MKIKFSLSDERSLRMTPADFSPLVKACLVELCSVGAFTQSEAEQFGEFTNREIWEAVVKFEGELFPIIVSRARGFGFDVEVG